MVRRVFGLSCALGILILTALSCGGSSTPPPAPPGDGTLFTLIQDAPSCDLLGYQIQVSALLLRPQGSISGAFTDAFSTATGTFIAPALNVESLRDSISVLNLARVREGIYDQARVTVTATSASVYDPFKTPPVSLLPLSQSATVVNVPIDPPLTITRGKITVLKLHYDVAKSVQADSQGQLTGSVIHTIGLAPVTLTSNKSYGEMNDIVGFVRSVSTTTNPGLGFIGGFLLQMFSGTGPAMTVNLTSSTQLLGAPALNQLLTASYVEVQGHIDSLGNLVADVVRVEDQEDLSKNQVAYIGPILSVTRGPDGNVRAFTMMVGETEPDESSSVPRYEGADVAVSSSTNFSTVIPMSGQAEPVPNVTFPSDNFANLPFDASTLVPGEEVAVNGIFTKIPGQPAQISADSIYLRPETVQGNFASLITAGSDDKTGAFRWISCGNIFQQVPTMVITDNNTTFINVSGLSGLTPVPALLVRGIALYEAQATTINGVQIPAGTLVILASQVHQI